MTKFFLSRYLHSTYCNTKSATLIHPLIIFYEISIIISKYDSVLYKKNTFGTVIYPY